MTIDQQAVAFLGFGEAAMAFVKGWATNRPETIKAFDIKTNDPDSAIRDGKNADYQNLNVLGTASTATAITDVPAIFSLVTADQAAIVAQTAAENFPKGVFFFDCNSCAPGTKRRNAEKIEAAGGRYVDVAVMAPVYPKMHKTPLLLSGPHAQAGLEYLQTLNMAPAIVEGDIGAGSSIKMIRSIMMKGLEALFAECVLAGRKAGVEEAVLASLDKTYPGFDFPAKAGYMLERSMTHGIRRAAEMEEVALTVHELGLDNEMASATVQWQRRIGNLKLDAGDLDYQDRADMILNALKK
ncbi:NAD(P)-dependent oxidoreductase [Thalassospira sp. TSL5-1]|uniref:NAD(P)-dependent oxidoreductase n=1 Tax=Thalassospira sp. TSL5-1 TaxID=1544451 RepID=UPI00093F7C72|nr:DUF1932 domain-containing protein [Thalassospira sp. TSL5-1]OKH87973.1 3-hydroxyisobutyrate dehydrogenase [Thalassospira sp. TSL5-1]